MSRLVVAAALWVGLVSGAAADCAGFKWPVDGERRVFAGEATSLAAGVDVAAAPTLAPGRLFSLALAHQEDVRLAVAPSKPMLPDDAEAGVVRVAIPAPGRWRVALDTGAWIDMVRDGAAVPSRDFSGSEGCDGPRKIVEYELAAAGEYFLQLSGATHATVRLAVTPAP